MSEEIFKEILNDSTGDYIFQAEILKAMRPNGWTNPNKESQ